MNGAFPPDMLSYGAGLLVLAGAFHLVLRWQASYADPLLLPIATLLNGLGLVMIHRLDLAQQTAPARTPWRCKQLVWSALSVVIAAAGDLALTRPPACCGATPTPPWSVGLGAAAAAAGARAWAAAFNGSRIWIGLGPFTFQPGEIAKILLAIFFAGYLVQTRDVLSLVGRRFLGIALPRARDLGPIIVAWLASLGVLVFENDLGSSLLFFGLFVAMLYVATERRSLDRHRPGAVLRRRLPGLPDVRSRPGARPALAAPVLRAAPWRPATSWSRA